MTETECEVCEFMLEVLTAQERDSIYRTSCQVLDGKIDINCPGHRPLFHHLMDKIPKSDYREVLVELRKDEEYYARIQFRCHWDERSAYIGEWHITIENERFGRRVDREWANIGLVRGWKERCMVEHGDQCNNPWKIPPARPAWLIDVAKDCLVDGHLVAQDAGYIALSYRWDNTNNFRVDAELLPKLLREKSLQSPEIRDRLSPIIGDVIQLARKIGERYVWIDALCIIHDDSQSTATQLNLMGAIYASASITIVAADGNARHGLPGIEGVTRPRVTTQEIIPFDGDKYIFIKKGRHNVLNYHAHVQRSAYNNRAWTFQEYVLSSRRLVFATGEIFWECTCAEWYEDCAYEPSHLPKLNPIAVGIADLGEYQSMIREFNERRLTYNEDAPAAIAGLLALCSRSFSGGFLYGLPEMYFDIALTWESYGAMRRRKPSGRSFNLKSALPSWSWIGWSVSVDIDFALNFRDIRSITTWYATRSLEDIAHARRINASWFGMRDTFFDDDQPLPSGWSKISWRNYKHDKLPADPWRYLFPTTEVHAESATVVPEQTPYIFCQTTRIRVHGHLEADGGRVSFRERDGGSVGGFCMDDIGERSSSSINPDEPFSVELAAICVIEDRYRGSGDSDSGDSDAGDKVFALVIEWINGVAYRRGRTRISKEFWDSHETLEQVRLILG